MDGLFIIDKPAGPTSHDVVARVRRATGCKKVGHTGTLDPMATGVLPLVVGRATRLAQFLSASEKVYEADVRLGWATDTYDALGRAVETSEVRSPGSGVVPPAFWPRGDQLEFLLARFRGTYLQTAPPFSAKKTDGVRAYALAREGRAFEPKACEVTVHELRCIGQEGDRLRVRIWCSAGFYVRSLANDLGLAAGVGAHLTALRRTRCGDFDISSAVPLEVIEREGRAAAFLTPIEAMLSSLPAVVVNQVGAERTRHGNDLRPEDLVSAAVAAAVPGRVRVLDERGMLLAIGERSARPGFLHPGIVVV